jgi:predicted esterase
MNPRELAVRALLLIPLLPVACSSGDESQSNPNGFYSGGRKGEGGNQGYGGVMGSGTGAAGGVVGQGGANGASGANGAGPGGSGGLGGGGGIGGGSGMGGGGGIGATGGIAGNGGTDGNAGSGNVGGTGNVGGSAGGGGREPVIPPVQGTCPSLATGTISVTRGSRTLGGIRVEAGAKPSGPTAPLVFYWHGTGGQSTEYNTQARAVRDGVIQEGGIIVSFQGTTGGDLLSGTSIFGAGDFELADQIVACAVMNYNIDPRRIFATGCSAGGLFSGAMGVMRSNYMAAIAPNSGGLLAPGMWQNANTPALMTIHGAAGRDVVVVDFSTTSKTADDAYKNHGGFVINCDHGGGHCGGAGQAPSIWTFFKAHPYGAGKPWSALPAGFSSVCKIY